jgi:hypothetical protein
VPAHESWTVEVFLHAPTAVLRAVTARVVYAAAAGAGEGGDAAGMEEISLSDDGGGAAAAAAGATVASAAAAAAPAAWVPWSTIVATAPSLHREVAAACDISFVAPLVVSFSVRGGARAGSTLCPQPLPEKLHLICFILV